MIISDNDVKEILKKEVVQDVEVCDLIVKYVFIKKGINIGRVKVPDNEQRLLMFRIAQTTVMDYFTKTLMNNES